MFTCEECGQVSMFETDDGICADCVANVFTEKTKYTVKFFPDTEELSFEVEAYSAEKAEDKAWKLLEQYEEESGPLSWIANVDW